MPRVAAKEKRPKPGPVTGKLRSRAKKTDAPLEETLTVKATSSLKRGPVVRNVFDEAYYKRFYLNPQTRVGTDAELFAPCELLCAHLNWLGIKPKTILDAGCGLGRWRVPLLRRYPKAKYTGLEFSTEISARLGWHQGSIDRFRPGKNYDLVLCLSVLQYLDDKSAVRAIANLGRLTTQVLFLEIITAEDWKKAVNQKRTDGACYLRPAAFYREQLNRYFINVGAGVFIRRNAPVTLYALERAE